MNSPTIAELLKYADLQMAAEAFLTNDNGTIKAGQNLERALINGNNRASRFTVTQATKFVKHWIVEAQHTTNTGFSGTLFKCVEDDPVTGAKKGELVLSFRSTEFIDDAARDNQATNVLEISKTGFAWGQIRDMQDWYENELIAAGGLLDGKLFSVTGYSLGEHLATAFNLINGAATETVTFNGAGVGAINPDPAITLKTLIRDFDQLSRQDYSTQITNVGLRAIYLRAQAAFRNGQDMNEFDEAELRRLANPLLDDPVNASIKN